MSGGRVAAWRDSLAYLGTRRRDVVLVCASLVAWLGFFNLPWWPPYLRGVFSGVGLALVVWWMAWVAWVQSGNSLRLQGIWAEDAVLDELRGHPHALAVVASYKIDGRDVDAVLVTRGALYAVEVKWQYRKPGMGQLRAWTGRLARDMQVLRDELDGSGLPERLVRGLLVVRGPGSVDLLSRKVEHDGCGIRVLNGEDLDGWLEDQDRGAVGPDFAADLGRRLSAEAARRDAELGLSRHLRYLARAR